jgi:hypothetical protein
MRYPALLLAVAALAAACLLDPAPLAAQPLANTDGAFTRIESSGTALTSRAQPEVLTFMWYPEIPVGDAGYALAAFCFRTNRLGGPPGSGNRLFFEATLAPISDSDAVVKLKQKRARLTKRGVQNRLVMWGGSQFEEIAAAGMEEGVIVNFEIGATGGVETGDRVGCEVSMTETNPRGIVAAGHSAAEADPRSTARRSAALHTMAPVR